LVALAVAIYDGKPSKRRIDASMVATDTGFCKTYS